METVRLICRKSLLSLLQAEIVKKKIEAVAPSINVEITGCSSRGDREQCIPLSTLEGIDFFTEEIFEALDPTTSEIAVHSLKDMSAFHFFSHNAFAIVDREDSRDVAIFNPGIEKKIIAGDTIVIGTCSPRRELMATDFLKKALPQLSDSIQIETRSIRGSVDNRLHQLHENVFDATILATAGLNRLLQSESAPLINSLLKGKRLMFLPLIECVPAPCQGAIVAEAHPHNKKMIALLKLINDEGLYEEAKNEKQEALHYGAGSLQQFGVTTITTSPGVKFIYAAGKNANGQPFTRWKGLPIIETYGKKIFNTADFMGGFFITEYQKFNNNIDEPAIYIANYKALRQKEGLENIYSKRIWTSGTKTWIELAKQGLWVEGSADGIGLESLKPVLSQPIVNLTQQDLHVITHSDGAKHWLKKGWKTTSAYSIHKKENPELFQQITRADIIFWTSVHQFLQYKDVLKEKVLHLSPCGETASLLKIHGIDPIIFPTIKSFEQWRKSSTRQLSVV